MRILLFTGKGGVGKSTVAAGTAALAAARGRRTLILSTDPAHSLADAYGTPVGPEPTRVAPGLHVQQVDAQRRFERSWAEIQGYLLTMLDVTGMDPVAAEELTVIPGAEEVLALLEVRDQALTGDWDVIVLDCAPTAETLRLLALPEALGWYFTRVLPVERRVVKALGTVLSRATGVPMPGDAVFDALVRLREDLAQVQRLLSGPDSSVRLVLTPETVVLAEARRTWTTLSLFGYRVDGVVANRVFPAEGADPWRAGWVAAQGEVLRDVSESFAGLPQWRSSYRTAEPVGVDALRELASELYGDDDPFAPSVGTSAEGPFTVTRTRSGTLLRLPLPLVTSDDVDLVRNGDELVVTVASNRRLLTLPAGLARLPVVGARVEGGELQVRFEEREASAPAQASARKRTS